MTAKEIKGVKGFDKNLRCRDKQYSFNAEFKEDEADIWYILTKGKLAEYASN